MAATATPVSLPAPAPSGQTVPSFQAAGFWRRLCAGAVDGLLLLPMVLALGALLSLVLGHPLPRLRELGLDLLVSSLAEGSPVGEALLPLCAVLLLLYFFLFHALAGRTPGKRLMGLLVIDVYGDRPGLGRTLLRTGGYLISALLLSLGFLWIGFDREKRALHDWLAGTYVVHTR